MAGGTIAPTHRRRQLQGKSGLVSLYSVASRTSYLCEHFAGRTDQEWTYICHCCLRIVRWSSLWYVLPYSMPWSINQHELYLFFRLQSGCFLRCPWVSRTRRVCSKLLLNYSTRMSNFNSPNRMGSATSDSGTKGWLVSILELGAWVGSLSTGYLADRISRKYTIFLGRLSQFSSPYTLTNVFVVLQLYVSSVSV